MNDSSARTSGHQAPGSSLLDKRRRIAALRECGLLDSDPESTFDRYTRIVRHHLGVPVSLVSLVTESRQFFKSAAGLDPACRGTPIDGSFCRHVLPGTPLIVSDARIHEILRDNPSIDSLGVIAYAGFPIRNSEGFVFGSLCAIDEQPREWTEQDLAFLEDLSAAVSSEIQLREQLLRERSRQRASAAALRHLERTQSALTDQLRHHEETTAMVSHDLKAPLSVLLMNTSLLKRDLEPEARERALARMNSAIHDMGQLIGDLLDVVRLNAGGMAFDFEWTTSHQLFEHLRNLHLDETRKRGIELALTGEVGLVADERRLTQALSNLVGNSTRALREGGTIEVTATQADERSVTIAVRDDGPGIPSEQMTELFNRFEQGAHAGSAGLGLSITKGIVDAHGGVIEVNSAPGEGACFTLTLPRHGPSESRQDGP